MNKIELLSLIREIVKDELKELLTTKSGRTLVREMITREVRIEVDKLLTEMEQGQDSREMVQESPNDIKLSRMVERGELPPKKSSKREEPKVGFTKNSKLNDMLNQTLDSIRKGDAQLPSMMGPESQVQLLKEQYPNMKIGESNLGVTRPVEESTGKSVVSMLPDKDVSGNPLMVNPTALPDHVQNALTRDYRKLMKKVEEKRG